MGRPRSIESQSVEYDHMLTGLRQQGCTHPPKVPIDGKWPQEAGIPVCIFRKKYLPHDGALVRMVGRAPTWDTATHLPGVSHVIFQSEVIMGTA